MFTAGIDTRFGREEFMKRLAFVAALLGLTVGARAADVAVKSAFEKG